MPRIKQEMRFNTDELLKRAEAEDGRVKDRVTDAGTALLLRIITTDEDMDYRKELDHLRFLSLCWLDKDGDLITAKHKREYISKHNI